VPQGVQAVSDHTHTHTHTHTRCIIVIFLLYIYIAYYCYYYYVSDHIGAIDRTATHTTARYRTVKGPTGSAAGKGYITQLYDTGGAAGHRLSASGASARSATADSGTSPIALPPGKPPTPASRGSAKEVRLHTDIMTREVEKVVERIVTVEVPGPERVVEVIKEVPVEHIVMKEVPVYIDRVIESDRVVTTVREVPVDRIVVSEVAVPVERIVTNEVAGFRV